MIEVDNSKDDLMATVHYLRANMQSGGREPPIRFDGGQRGGDDSGMADPITRTELDAKFDTVRADMKAGVADLRVEFASFRGEVREGFASIRADFAVDRAAQTKEVAAAKQSFAEDRTANIRWTVTTGMGAAILVIAVLGFWINNLYKASNVGPTSSQPSATAAPPAPAASHP